MPSILPWETMTGGGGGSGIVAGDNPMLDQLMGPNGFLKRYLAGDFDPQNQALDSLSPAIRQNPMFKALQMMKGASFSHVGNNGKGFNLAGPAGAPEDKSRGATAAFLAMLPSMLKGSADVPSNESSGANAHVHTDITSQGDNRATFRPIQLGPDPLDMSYDSFRRVPISQWAGS